MVRAPCGCRCDELVRLAGPEDEALSAIEPDEWEGDVDAMQDSLDGGWQPPPLLAEYQDGRLLLQDGNHRYEALVRAGETARVDADLLLRPARARRVPVIVDAQG